MFNKKKRIFIMACAFFSISVLSACSSSTSSASDSSAVKSETETATEATTANLTETASESGTLLGSIVTKSQGMTTISVTDAANNKLFANGNAESGVKSIIAAGNFYINGFAIPKSAEELSSAYPNGYTVNDSVWLSGADGSWKVDGKDYTTYEEASLAVVQRIPAGLEMRIYDTNGDGYADRVDADYLEALIADKITKNNDNTYSIVRLDPTVYAAALSKDGKTYDGTHFTAASGEKISAENFDTSIKEGDLVLFSNTPSGWKITKAIAVTGNLIDGKDHEYYQIDDKKYDDAMRFSRDNIIISNRCGEFVNALNYFGYIGSKDLTVTLWFVPTSDPAVMGAPAGFTTSSEDAAAILKSAIATATDKLSKAVISEDGSGVASGTDWVTSASHDDISAVITSATSVLSANAPADMMNFKVYQLYLALNGTGNDIGAAYGGFSYLGLNSNSLPSSDANAAGPGAGQGAGMMNGSTENQDAGKK